jgi:Outer membrane protein beta-barrel domain
MKVIAAFIFLVFTYVSKAQVYLAVRGGLNMSSIKFYDFKPEKRSLVRLTGGLLFDFPFDEKWSVNTGLGYSGKGVKHSRTPSTGKIDSFTIRLNYIELPVCIAYRLTEKEQTNFIIGAGLYLGYGFNGTISTNKGNRIITEHLHKKETDQYKRFDFGMNANIICEISPQYGLRLDYATSISNIHRVGKEKNNVLGLSFFWNFKNDRRGK